MAGKPLRIFLLIVTLSALLPIFAGLSSVAAKEPLAFEPKKAALSESSASINVPPNELESDDSTGAQSDSLPDVPLTSDRLFMLLTAEVAYQRGDWMRGYTIMLKVAKNTRDPRVARRAAEMAANARQPAEALVAVRLWRELVPNSEAAARYLLGFILLSDDLSEAEPIFVMRLKKAPAYERGIMMYQMQRLLAGSRNKEQAFAILEVLVAPYLKMPQAHIALSQGALHKGERERAIQEAKRALAIKPDSSLAVLVLVQASGKVAEAEKILTEFLAAYPNSREVHMAYARILATQKKYAQARHEFEALLKGQPKDRVLLYSLGILATQTNDPKSAEKYLMAYMEETKVQRGNDRDTLQGLLILAQLSDERGDAKAALNWLAQIEVRASRGRAYVSARIMHAQIVARRDGLEEARQILAETKVKGTAAQVHLLLAENRLLRDVGAHQKALLLLESGKQKFPDNTRVLYDYAMLAEKLGKLTEMEASLRRIIVLEPDNHHAYNALGYSLANRNLRLSESQELIARALELAPNDAFIMDSMGWLRVRQGRLDDAEKLLRRAYEKHPDVEIAVHLGEVLWLKGKKAEARKLWREVTTKESNNDTLQETLRRLNVKF